MLVSSLVDLEAEEGKIVHLINLLLLLREGNIRSIPVQAGDVLRGSPFRRCGAILFAPREISACTGWVTSAGQSELVCLCWGFCVCVRRILAAGKSKRRGREHPVFAQRSARALCTIPNNK